MSTVKMYHLILSFSFLFLSIIAGFLKTGTKGSAQGNFGLMDLVAGLHWLRENLPAFNGNPNMVTLMGHGHGAALANILIVSPVASGSYYCIYCFCMTYVLGRGTFFPRLLLGNGTWKGYVNLYTIFHNEMEREKRLKYQHIKLSVNCACGQN
jgi:hypothetical protein